MRPHCHRRADPQHQPGAVVRRPSADRCTFGATGLLALLGVALGASPALAAKQHLTHHGPPLLLLDAPAPTTEWTAGATATIAWQPTSALATGYPWAFEWEAFLSLDGGRSWPIRLTPHLSLDHRSVEVDVPPYPSDDARLLLRIGDELREVEVPVAHPLRIAPAPRATAWRVQPRLRLGAGEPARAGAAGVTRWAEAGPGARWHVRGALATPAGLGEARLWPLLWLPPAGPPVLPVSLPVRTDRARSYAGRTRLSRARRPFRRPTSRLHRELSRFNE